MKIPIFTNSLTEEQVNKIKDCVNYDRFEILDIKDIHKVDGFCVVVNDATVGKDFLNFMLYGMKEFERDNQTLFIDAHTPTDEALPKKANCVIYYSPSFSGVAYGTWRNKVNLLCTTESERKIIQEYMDNHGSISVKPFVSRAKTNSDNDFWIDNGDYKLVSNHGFHFQG